MSTPPDWTRDTAPRRAADGKALQFAVIMLGACVALGLIIGLLMPTTGEVRPGAPSARLNVAKPTKSQTKAVPNRLIYRADPSGHFFVDAEVNGRTIHFLVDTGATFVALTPEDARAAGITLDSLRFSETVSTANGETRVARTVLRDVRLDQLSVESVSAVVMEQPMAVSLLGMSFLRHLEGYSVHDGLLELEW